MSSLRAYLPSGSRRVVDTTNTQMLIVAVESLQPSSGPRWTSICIFGPPPGPLRPSARYGSPGRTCKWPGAHPFQGNL